MAHTFSLTETFTDVRTTLVIYPAVAGMACLADDAMSPEYKQTPEPAPFKLSTPLVTNGIFTDEQRQRQRTVHLARLIIRQCYISTCVRNKNDSEVDAVALAR